MTLREAFALLSTDEIRAIAEDNQIELGPNPLRRDIVAKLTSHLTSASGLAATLGRLNAAERRAIDMLVADGGALPARYFERENGMLQFRTPYPIGGAARRAAPRPTTTTRLYYAGLVYPGFGKIGTWQGDIYWIPEDVLAHLPGASLPPIEDILQSAADPAIVHAQGDLIHDIGMLLCYLQRETVRAVRGDQLPKRDVVRLSAEFSIKEDLTDARTEGDTRWLLFVHHMAAVMGLVRTEGGLISPSESAETWLQQPAERQLRDAWSAYLKDTGWSELDGGIADRNPYGYAPTHNLERGRSRVIETLKHCLPRRWYTIDSLSESMKAHDAFFLRGRGSSIASMYWDSSVFYGSWAQIEARFIGFMLCRSLAAFNVVETGGPSADGSCTLFRLTERGAVLIGLLPGATETSAAVPIVVQPNFDVIVPREAPPHVLFRLQQIAGIVTRDRASIYRLSPDSVWRHLQSGSDADAMIAFLEQASQRPLPQNVSFSIRDWAARYGEITLERADLLRTRSAALMTELRANRKLALSVDEELNATVGVLRDADVTALIESLRKAGYWPQPGRGVPGAMTVKEAGRSNIAVPADDLIRLLAGALVLAAVAESYGCQSPVPERIVRSIVPRLSPALVRQVRRLADDSAARLRRAMSGHEPDEASPDVDWTSADADQTQD